MEKHLDIGSSLYGEFDISLLVTEQTALLVVCLMLQSRAYEILKRLGQLGGTGRRLVSTAHIPVYCFISTPSVHSAMGQGDHGLWLGLAVVLILLLAVGKAHTWAYGMKVLRPSGSGGKLAICHQSSGLGTLMRLRDLLFQLIFGSSLHLS